MGGRQRGPWYLAIVAISALHACTEQPLDPVRATSVAMISGDKQRTFEGSALPAPLVVSVRDQQQNPLRGIVVHWTATSGTLSAASTTTDESGAAQVTLTVGAPHASIRVTASVEGVGTVTFSAVAIVRGWLALTMGQPTCGIATDSTAYCWGYNALGGLGDPSLAEDALVRTPRRVPGLPLVKDISADNAAVCAIGVDGSLWCWGSNMYLTTGAPPSALSTCTLIGLGAQPCARSPVRVNTSFRAYQIDMGPFQSCAIADDRGVWCWGRGAVTENASVKDVLLPRAVFPGQSFKSIRSGYGYTCGIPLFASLVRCWGWNLGFFYTSAPWLEVPLPSNVPSLRGQPAVVTAFDSRASTCVVLLSTRGAYCWGAAFAREDGGDVEGGSDLAKVLLPNESIVDVRRSDGFSRFTCARTDAGQLYCWGSGDRGQLGTRDAIPACASVMALTCTAIPRRVELPEPIVDFVLGSDQACAWTSTFKAYCWGANQGTLGDGGLEDRRTPVLIVPPS